MATVHVHPVAAPVASFLRVGHTGQKKLEALHAAGRFPYRRVVFRQMDSQSGVAEARRADHFLLRHLDPAVRTARYASRLRIHDEKTKKLIGDAKSRLIRFRDAMADLHICEAAPTYSQPALFRGGGPAISAILGG